MKKLFKPKPKYMRACYLMASGVTSCAIALPYSRKEHKILKWCIRQNLKNAPEMFQMGWIEYADQFPQVNPVNYHPVKTVTPEPKAYFQTKPSN